MKTLKFVRLLVGVAFLICSMVEAKVQQEPLTSTPRTVTSTAATPIDYQCPQSLPSEPACFCSQFDSFVDCHQINASQLLLPTADHQSKPYHWKRIFLRELYNENVTIPANSPVDYLSSRVQAQELWIIDSHNLTTIPLQLANIVREKLAIHRCPKLNVKLDELPSSLKNLELEGVDKISALSNDALSKKLPQLDTLLVRNASIEPPTFMNEVHFTKLVYLDVDNVNLKGKVSISFDSCSLDNVSGITIQRTEMEYFNFTTLIQGPNSSCTFDLDLSGNSKLSKDWLTSQSHLLVANKHCFQAIRVADVPSLECDCEMVKMNTIFRDVYCANWKKTLLSGNDASCKK